MMTSVCIFETSRGPEVKGTVYSGQDEVRRGVEDVFAIFPDAQWNNPTHFIAGDRGVSEWVFTGTGPDGARVEVQGCDVFTFRDGKIAIKNSYENSVPPDLSLVEGSRSEGDHAIVPDPVEAERFVSTARHRRHSNPPVGGEALAPGRSPFEHVNDALRGDPICPDERLLR
jgi:hypothetical protein